MTSVTIIHSNTTREFGTKTSGSNAMAQGADALALQHQVNAHTVMCVVPQRLTHDVCGTATFNTSPQPALRAQGTAVYFVIITNGNKGCGAQFCQNFTTDQIASCAAAFLQPKPSPSSVTHFTCRRQEALAAAASLGVSPSRVRMLGFEDGGLDATA
jgi:hypothetical protein